MAEWTPEATEYLEGYLRQVAALARHQGDDVDEIVQDLRDHIVHEVEADEAALVTIERLRKILAVIGTPEQVAGVEGALTPNGGGEEASLRANIEALRLDVLRAAGKRMESVRDKLGKPPVNPAPTQAQPPGSAKPWGGLLRGCLIAVFISFGLLVLLSVVSIVASIALPNLLRSRETARRNSAEQLALQVLGLIARVQENFREYDHKDIDGDGIADYGTLFQLEESGRVEWAFSHASVDNLAGHGYQLSMTVTPSSQPGGPGFRCEAKPVTSSTERFKTYVVDQSGEIQAYTSSGVPTDEVFKNKPEQEWGPAG